MERELKEIRTLGVWDMRFVQHHFPYFDAVEILVMAGGALFVVSLALAM
jgi:hypothetical protein